MFQALQHYIDFRLEHKYDKASKTLHIQWITFEARTLPQTHVSPIKALLTFRRHLRGCKLPMRDTSTWPHSLSTVLLLTELLHAEVCLFWLQIVHCELMQKWSHF